MIEKKIARFKKWRLHHYSKKTIHKLFLKYTTSTTVALLQNIPPSRLKHDTRNSITFHFHEFPTHNRNNQLAMKSRIEGGEGYPHLYNPRKKVKLSRYFMYILTNNIYSRQWTWNFSIKVTSSRIKATGVMRFDYLGFFVGSCELYVTRTSSAGTSTLPIVRDIHLQIIPQSRIERNCTYAYTITYIADATWLLLYTYMHPLWLRAKFSAIQVYTTLDVPRMSGFYI